MRLVLGPGPVRTCSPAMALSAACTVFAATSCCTLSACHPSHACHQSLALGENAALQPVEYRPYGWLMKVIGGNRKVRVLRIKEWQMCWLVDWRDGWAGAVL